MATSIRAIHAYQANSYRANAAVSPEDPPRLRRHINNLNSNPVERIRLVSRLNILEAISLNVGRREQIIRGWLKDRRNQENRGLSKNEPINRLIIINFDWPKFSIIRPPTFLKT